MLCHDFSIKGKKGSLSLIFTRVLFSVIAGRVGRPLGKVLQGGKLDFFPMQKFPELQQAVISFET